MTVVVQPADSMVASSSVYSMQGTTSRASPRSVAQPSQCSIIGDLLITNQARPGRTPFVCRHAGLSQCSDFLLRLPTFSAQALDLWFPARLTGLGSTETTVAVSRESKSLAVFGGRPGKER